MKTSQHDTIQNVVNALLKPIGEPKNFILPLAEFKTVFKEVQKHRSGTKIDVILNGDWAIVQFSELCNHRIRVLPDNSFHPVLKLLGVHQYIEEEDFEIAAAVANIYGQRKYLTLGRFVLEEFLTEGLPGLTVFLISGILFAWLINLSSSFDVIKSANDLLIGVSTIFFSIFMLFTASQNLSSIVTPDLFKQGLTHRFIQVDKMVSWISIAALGLAGLNRVVVETISMINIETNIGRLFVLNSQRIIPWTTSLAVSLITISFLIVVRYYYKRVQNLLETDLSKKLLDETFERQNIEK